MIYTFRVLCPHGSVSIIGLHKINFDRMHKKALLSEMNILLIQYMIHKQVNGIMTMALICGKIEYSVILFVDLFQKIHALNDFFQWILAC